MHSSSRERVLREIEARGSASVAELREATGLHENTVRGHLDRLCSDGYLRSERALPDGRGRPSLRWYAVRAESRNPYASLAIALASTLSEADVDAANLMRAAGVSWGTQLAAERQGARETRGTQNVQSTPSTHEPQSPHAETIKLVFDVMRDQGFAPEEPKRNGSGLESLRKDSGTGAPLSEIRLRNCPILEAAKGNTEVVCAAHRGLVEGLIRSRGDSLGVGLEPFVASDLCVLTLGSEA